MKKRKKKKNWKKRMKIWSLREKGRMNDDNKGPNSIVCFECKKETGIKGEDILNKPFVVDLLCPFCQKLIFSCQPEVRKKYKSTSSSPNNETYKFVKDNTTGGHYEVRTFVQGMRDEIDDDKNEDYYQEWMGM